MNPRNPWFVAGFLAGCAIGGAVALLLAPTSGRDLVGAIREHLDRAKKDARDAGREAEADILARYKQIRDAAAPAPPGVAAAGGARP
ncbi:MAG: YtxH domain-containing protein [Chloroflexota bacterium]